MSGKVEEEDLVILIFLAVIQIFLRIFGEEVLEVEEDLEDQIIEGSDFKI